MKNTSLAVVVAAVTMGLAVMVIAWRWSAAETPSLIDVGQSRDTPLAVVEPRAELVVPRLTAPAPGRVPVGDVHPAEPAVRSGPSLVTATEAMALPETPAQVKVRVRVVDVTGKPLVHVLVAVTVRLYSDGSGGRTSIEPMDFSVEPVTSSSWIALTDETGTIVVFLDRELFPELYNSILIEHRDAGLNAWVEGLVLPSVGILDLGTVMLLKPSERYPVPIVRGTLLDPMGEPVPGARGTVSDTRWISQDSTGGKDIERSWPARADGEVVIDADGTFDAFGPSGAESLELTFTADGFDEEYASSVASGTDGLRVVMARRLYWSGKLVVPGDGPPVSEYGVWISEEGRGSGVSPAASGRFRAVGSSRSVELKVCHPSLGAVLYLRDFGIQATEDGDLGVVDIRAHVQVIDAICMAADGAPWSAQEMEIRYVDGGAEKTVSIVTDGDGRLLGVLPVSASAVRVGRRGVEAAEVFMGAGQMRWTLR